MARPSFGQRPRYTEEWIDSNRCDWPLMVKRLAKMILQKRAELSGAQDRFTDVDMMDPRKADLALVVGQLQLELASLYKNLGKELAYHRSITND